MAKPKRITLSIQRKGEILLKLKDGVNGKLLALQYCVGMFTVSDIRETGDKIWRYK